MDKRILVVGGGYAGTSCAARLARKTRRTGASVALVDPRPHFVERIRLHEDVAGREMRRRVPLREHLAGTGVEVITGRVDGVDLRSRRARIEGRDEAFDELVVATGSSSVGPDHAVGITTEEDALTARERLSSAHARRVVICGGGLTGVELAAELAEKSRGLDVTLVTAGEIVPGLSTGARDHARGFFRRSGVRLFENRRVAAVEKDAVVLESGDALPSDVTLWAGGFRASRFAADIGLPTDADGRALVDPHLRSTAYPFVRVAGDVASTELRMACATAVPMGCFVADDLANEIHGREAPAFSFAYFVICVSLGRRDGLVQKVDARDEPTGMRLDGRGAAWFKEFICRFAMASSNEGWGIEYRWPHGREGRHTALRGGATAPVRHRLSDAR